ncbi:MAG: hypothetical protein HYZ34_13030 [Ignavibacteriae bacterium]|nr:hypothetical protein [Ignavibacteriota bacterium]
MNYTKLIEELEMLVSQVGVKLRYEKGDFEGGYCVLKEEQVLVVNKRLTDVRRASILAQALMQIGVEAIFIKPNIRDFIDNESAKYLQSKKNLVKRVDV